MDKIKIFTIGLLICFLGAGTLFIFNLKNREMLRQKVILAREMHGVLENILFDLSEASENSIQGVPADGLWHHHIVFYQDQLGPMEYMLKDGRLLRINNGRVLMVADNMAELRLRRQARSSGLLDVQIEVKKNVSLTINIKVRLHR